VSFVRPGLLETRHLFCFKNIPDIPFFTADKLDSDHFMTLTFDLLS